MECSDPFRDLDEAFAHRRGHMQNLLAQPIQLQPNDNRTRVEWSFLSQLLSLLLYKGMLC